MKDLKIGIITGSTREGRVSPQVAQWVLDYAKQKGQANFEVIDIKDFKLPFLGEGFNDGVVQFQNKLKQMDGFIFVVAEYNHSITGALKNALDWAREEWNNKSAGIVSYGSVGGARAAEHLRGILGELMVADVRSHVLLSLFTDFDGQTFKPQALHQANLDALLDQVVLWGTALKTIRK
ncbi:MAG: NAD(P)H-dependent oxidoreductase [Acholeplasma sp.]|jgi:NAD(P)H-dependent FMN reductase|nr:NAD(P)H-dependent oxidoreductase [Acholeplasma sp.]